MKSGRLMAQTRALTRKNFTLALFRSPVSTFIQALALPILILTLLLEIPYFTPDNNKYGVGRPAAILSLRESMRATGGKKLVIVESHGLGPDFPDVLSRLTAPLDAQTVVHLTNEDDVARACSVDFHGQSNCHAVVSFNDTPKSGRVNATWDYDVKIAPASGGGQNFNPFTHTGDAEGAILPLQLAIDNAITDSTVIPEVFAFTQESQAQHDETKRKDFAGLATYLLSFVFFLTMTTLCYHVSSMVITERESGLTQLMDAMGGPETAWSRIASYIIAFDLLYLPLWIILGCIFWKLFAPTTNPAVLVFWQVFTGWAVTHASIFAAAFFRRAALGAIVIACISYLLSIVAAYVDNASFDNPPSLTQVVVLGLLFPSMNYTFFFDYLGRLQMSLLPMRLSQPRPQWSVEAGTSFFSPEYSWTTEAPPYLLWLLLAVQIIAFPFLAWVVEYALHRNNRRYRVFDNSAAAHDSHTAIEVSNLEKHYRPSIWRKIFCCCCCGARNPSIKAVDGLRLTSQKNQILCLVGPNGSGKSTALDMIAGVQVPSHGDIRIRASPYSMGICPQKNILWENLTVYEHVVLWNMLKGNTESPQALDALIETCHLTLKKSCLSKHLSGGMQRKLQLACMLVGGSSVCLMDEVTSGMDPVSRRVIWNAILKERSKRTMIFTTHFLDECEVLSDQIVVLSVGRVKCQGTPAELKSQHGGGYRVRIPKTESVSHVQYPIVDGGERYICTTPDPSSAAEVLASFKRPRDTRFSITGPTIEDVFLNVTEDPQILDAKSYCPDPGTERMGSRLTIMQPSVLQQMRALILKRIIILRSQWLIYLIVLAIPIIVTAFGKNVLGEYKPPACQGLVSAPTRGADPVYMPNITEVAAGPPAINRTMTEASRTSYDLAFRDPFSTPSPRYFNASAPVLLSTRQSLYDYYAKGNQTVRNRARYGGIYVEAKARNNDKNNNEKGIDRRATSLPPLLAIPADARGSSSMVLMNFMTMVRTGTPIAVAGSSLWITIFAAMMSFYPVFFTLYPAYERQSGVRALQYSNGVRTVPLWTSHLLFDSFFVLVISIICTFVLQIQAPYWGLGYVFFVLMLYGIAATITVYTVSTFASSQSAAFSLALLVMLAEFVGALVPTMVIGAGDESMEGVVFGLGLILPIENLIRALSVSLNANIVRCRGTDIVDNPGSIYAYGGPILLLILYIAGGFFLLMRLDGSTTMFSFGRRGRSLQRDEELEHAGGSSGGADVEKEAARVAASSEDLMRLLGVSKSFGGNLAIDNVSLGVRKDEILALLGPNGAGKSTVINMIRGGLAPSLGSILLEGDDIARDPRLARRHVGVCPQHDALDLLTVREHLRLYARCKGLADVRAAADRAAGQVGLGGAQADKTASRLSGGMKRKLSLAIALLGDPPVLLVDEPSTAMDAAAKRVLWQTLKAVAPGRSVLLTTHSMEEADALATRLLAVGTTRELRAAHSNELHVHLVLGSAPGSPPDEMAAVERWVVDSLPGVQFEGTNLGGQVRFILPAESPVADRALCPSPAANGEEGDALPLSERDGGSRDEETQSLTVRLIEVLEQNKSRLGINCYSIGAATMERVFMSVVKESDAPEEDGWRRTESWHSAAIPLVPLRFRGTQA
ncbi:hypothetical protein PG991_005663 [Apiospora marii]|uniref:ABC transporter domain-containing protein n=1 Tax=Apiospora marii TaxID=335849 RepID=A0ABR1S9V2_9PEZI